MIVCVCVCGKKLGLTFLCKDVYSFYFYEVLSTPVLLLFGPYKQTLTPQPLGLPSGAGSPGSSPARVSQGPVNRVLGYFTSFMSSLPSQTPCPEHPRGVQPWGLPRTIWGRTYNSPKHPLTWKAFSPVTY